MDPDHWKFDEAAARQDLSLEVPEVPFFANTIVLSPHDHSSQSPILDLCPHCILFGNSELLANFLNAGKNLFGAHFLRSPL